MHEMLHVFITFRIQIKEKSRFISTNICYVSHLAQTYCTRIVKRLSKVNRQVLYAPKQACEQKDECNDSWSKKKLLHLCGPKRNLHISSLVFCIVEKKLTKATQLTRHSPLQGLKRLTNMQPHPPIRKRGSMIQTY